MLLRPTIAADFEAIADLTNLFIRTTPIHFAYEPVPVQELEDLWRSTASTYPWFTAEIDGRFAGYAKAGVWRTRAAYQWTAEAGIYVVPEFHAKGIGKALYQAVIDDLRRRGFHAVIGGVTLPNPASVRLHESLGFDFVGQFKDAGYKFNQWHDVGFWQLMLTGAGQQSPKD